MKYLTNPPSKINNRYSSKGYHNMSMIGPVVIVILIITAIFVGSIMFGASLY